MAAVGVTALCHDRVRTWLYTWGSRPDEVAAVLPGDDLVEPHTPRTTRAVTIDAPVEAVWPWLAQIGEDRGGFYSYSVLERAIGADIRNADRIHPEWQQSHVGDTVWLARRYGPSARQVVAAVEPNSHLVLMSADDFDRVRRGEKASGAWSFHLRQDAGRTRLVARGCGGAVGHLWFDALHFIMEQKMLRGIRDRTRCPHAQVGTISPRPRRSVVPDELRDSV
jgi:hypothetical protein